MTSKIKVYELAKELDIDPQHMVDTVKRLGIDVKNSMSVLGSEEVRTVRDHYRRNRPLGKKVEPPPAPSGTRVTEKRVGATVIRRRAKTVEPEPPPVEEAPVEEVPAPVDEELSAPAEEVAPEPEEAAEETSAPVQAPAAQQAAAPAAEAAPARKGRKFFPSIIKKVATEDHLSAKVGPKVERPKREPSTTAAKPGTAGTAAAGATGLKRVKEIDPNATVGTEVKTDATTGKKRVMENQTATFKRADFLKREMVHSTKKRRNVVNRPAMKTLITTPAEHKRVVEMGSDIQVGALAKDMGIKAAQLIGKLMAMGVTASLNESIDHDTAVLVAQEFNYEVKQKIFREEDYIPTLELKAEDLKPRPPVVTIMGHVDHGKTSLLDYIRKAKVAAGEAGGITQHVGAYTVKLPKGNITFIDTPGHEAFTSMRARGAKVTDIVIVVVSAVDGVMPQTLESISHAQAANVPIIVAVNKIDLPEGNPDKIKQVMAGHGLNPEEWGGDTIYVNVSAKTGKGVDNLLEAILLQAEMLELKANYDIPARGIVIECKLDKSRGAVASVLIQHGKLTAKDIVVSGAAFGKVRALTNSFGQRVTEALPGDPVEILGLPTVPNVGDEIVAFADERSAREYAEVRTEMARQKDLAGKSQKLTLEEMMNAPAGEKELRIVLKSDVQGSAEALRESLTKFPSDKVKIRLLHTGTGGVTESDVMLATASRAVILGFNIRPDVKAQKIAEQEGVTIRTYTIIYDLLEDLKRLAEGLLDSKIREKVIGRAEVREVFSIPKVGVVAGSAVIDGKVQRGCFLRLLRDSRVVYEGKLSSLRRFKEDVKEVASGFECGIGLENFNDVKLGDQFEAFLKEEVKGTL